MNEGFSVLRGGISDKIKNTVERGPRLLSVRRGRGEMGPGFVDRVRGSGEFAIAEPSVRI